MGWLGRLLGQERPSTVASASSAAAAPPPAVSRLRPPPEGPWADTELRLHAQFAADLARFAAQHQGVAFYGFGADCHMDAGEILLCANTPTGLREQAVQYTANGTKGRIAEEEEDLRWGLGYWVHHGLGSADTEASQRYRAALPRMVWPLSEVDREAGLECVCRALLRLAADGSLDALQRTHDFRVVCVDHSEDIEAAEARMVRVQQTLARR